MKKIPYIILGLLLIGIVSAVMFSNREEAFAHFNQMKSEREQGKVKGVVSDVVYLTDKECEIQYNSEQVLCSVLIQFKFLEKTYELLVPLDENGTPEQDDEIVELKLSEYLDVIELEHVETPEVVKFTAGERKNRQIDVKEK